MTSWWLIPAFALVALAYAAAGFGGGSSYNAILVLSGTDYRAIPVIALTCNLIVVSGGVYHFHRAGHLQLKSLLPFVFASIPMAWLGGRLPVSEALFTGMLGLALTFTGLSLLWRPLSRPAPFESLRAAGNWRLGLPAGAGIGLVSGVVGIGGGIFLAPLLYLAGQKTPRQIAALCSGFILVNSLAGLLGQFMKQGGEATIGPWQSAWPLYLAVFVGGQLGSRLGAARLPEGWVRGMTALLVLYVGGRLLYRWAGMTLA